MPPFIRLYCQQCGRSFLRKRCIVITGRGQYCSRPCRSAAETRTLPERFWSHVQRTDDCWLWTTAKNPKGYGIFNIDKKRNKNELAHRISYRLVLGAIPDDLRVLHHCDTPSCVNPSHLFLGTPGDNMVDKVAKNRQQKGEGVPNAKLTDAQVIEIRQRYRAGDISQAQLAREYGVTHATMGSLLHRKTWHHLP